MSLEVFFLLFLEEFKKDWYYFFFKYLLELPVKTWPWVFLCWEVLGCWFSLFIIGLSKLSISSWFHLSMLYVSRNASISSQLSNLLVFNCWKQFFHNFSRKSRNQENNVFAKPHVTVSPCTSTPESILHPRRWKGFQPPSILFLSPMSWAPLYLSHYPGQTLCGLAASALSGLLRQANSQVPPRCTELETLLGPSTLS